MPERRNTKTNRPRKKYFLGVEHTTRLHFADGPRTHFLRNLQRQITRLRRLGITKVGIEYLPELQSRKEWNPVTRYFHGAKLLLKRSGIEATLVDDPEVLHFQQWLSHIHELGFVKRKRGFVTDFFYEETPQIKQREDYQRVKNYFKGSPPDILEFIGAANYLRTQLMLRNAKKKGLSAIIAGNRHMAHVRLEKKDEKSKNQFRPIDVDQANLPDFYESLGMTTKRQQECYKKYGPTLLRIVRDIKRKKLNLQKM